MANVNYTVIIAAVLLLMASCGKKEETGPATVFVKTATVAASDSLAGLSWPGRTKATEDVNVAFRVSGPIKKLYVNEGDHVSKGQLIAEMDPRDYEVQLGATQAEYANIKADAERIIAMYNEGNTTASNYDKARYGLQQVTEKLNNHRNQLADTKLYSPIDGYVQSRIHQAGETVGAGMPVVSMFASGNTEVEIFIPASDYSRKGQLTRFYCTFDIMPGVKLPLEITRMGQEANASQLYPVRLKIKGDYDKGKITPGMTTMVYASLDSGTGSMVYAPTTAVFDSDGVTSVFVFDKESGTISKRTVTIGKLKTDGSIEIASGLAPGDIVVSAGTRHLTDGQKVKPLPGKTSSNVGGLL